MCDASGETRFDLYAQITSEQLAASVAYTYSPTHDLWLIFSLWGSGRRGLRLGEVRAKILGVRAIDRSFFEVKALFMSDVKLRYGPWTAPRPILNDPDTVVEFRFDTTSGRGWVSIH